MKLKAPQWARRSGRVLAALAVGASLLVSSTAAVANAAGQPHVAASTGAARALHLSTAVQRQLLRRYAAYRHIPRSDITRITPDTRVARTANGTEWALEGFVPSARAPLAVRVSFQDAASLGVFTEKPGKSWQVNGLGQPVLACDDKIPASVRRAWGLGNCPAATAAPSAQNPSEVRPSVVRPMTSGTTAEIVTLANANVGVGDNPASENFDDDCNPYTGVENPAASSSGCGTSTNVGDPPISDQDLNEFWCADFAKYIWQSAGVIGPTSALTPGAASFYGYGSTEGESMPTDPPVSDAQVGDAIVLYPPGTTPNSGSADHVGIITGVDDSAGTIDVVNGDMPWGTSYIEVSDAGYNTPQYFANTAEGQSGGLGSGGEEWVFVAPQLPAVADVNSLTEFADNQGYLYGYAYDVTAGSGSNDQTGLGMGSGPSTAALSDGSYITAFQDPQGDLYLHPSSGSNDPTGLGMATSTTPSVAAFSSGDGYIVAFQDAEGYLYLHPSSGSNDSTGLGMYPSTRPAIAASGSSWVVAFEANNGHLYIKTSGGVQQDMGLGMMEGTNPAIAMLADGGFAVAFQANTGLLYTYVTTGTTAADVAGGTETDSKLGMDNYTSPAIAAGSSSTWRVAFTTNTDYLYQYSSAGAETTSGLGVASGTSPAIAVEPNGSTYIMAFIDAQGDLYLHTSTGTNDPTGLGMAEDFSPTIAVP